MNLSQKSLVSVLFFIIILVIGLTWVIHRHIVEDSQAELADSLNAVLHTTHQAMSSWIREHETLVKVWANSPQVRQAAKELLAISHDKNTLLASDAQLRLRSWYQPMQFTGYQDFFIISPDNINLASSRDQNVGMVNLLDNQGRFLDLLWKGESTISLPVKSDVALTNSKGQLKDGLSTMFVGAPIFNEDQKIIALFTFRLNPNKDFTNILQSGRIGKTGETYAFDGLGRLISNIRFEDQLRAIGLISPEEEAIFNIEIRDPGVNLIEIAKPDLAVSTQPFTRMAKNAIEGQSGHDLKGYRDFRGVTVVGAWLWDSSLEFGIATELEKNEADHSLTITTNIIITLTIMIVLSITGLFVYFILYRQRLKVEMALRQSENHFISQYEAIPAPVYTWQKKGDEFLLINYNQAADEFTEGQAKGLLGKTLNEVYGEVSNSVVKEDIKTCFLNQDVIRRETYYQFKSTAKIKYLDIVYIPLAPDLVMVQTYDLTERKYAEEALRESEARWRSLTEHSPDHILTLDRNLNIEFVNYASPGMAVEQLMGTPLYKFVSQQKQAEVKTILEKSLNTGKPLMYETQFEAPGKDIIYYESSVAPRIISGKIIGLTVNSRDITGRRQGEIALHRSEVLECIASGAELKETLDALVNNADKHDPEMLCSVLLVDDEGKFLRHSSTAKLSDFFTRAIDGIEIGPEIVSCGAAAYTGKRVVVEDIRIHPNWVNYREHAEKEKLRACWSEPIISSIGKIFGTFAVYYREPKAPSYADLEFIQDSARLAGIAIERKQADEILKTSESDLKGILDSLQDIYYRTDLDGLITRVSSSVINVTGYQSDELIGTSIFQYWRYPEKRQEMLNALNLGNGAIQNFEVEGIHKNGSIVWGSINAHYYLNKQGQISGVEGSIRNVTEYKKLIEQDQQHQNELAHIARLSTMGEMATGIAHELNQPLSAIANYVSVSQLLLKSEVNESAQLINCLEAIDNQAMRASEIIRHLRQFVKKQSAEKAVINLNELIKDVVNFTQAQLDKNQVKTGFALDVEPSLICVDAIQIEQVLVNLIYNGVEAMKSVASDNRRLNIRTSLYNKDMIKVEVVDTGTGIDKETSDYIFEPFVTTKGEKGMGMGLSISRSIIEAHGGRLWVESALGKGASFFFTLPLNLDEKE